MTHGKESDKMIKSMTGFGRYEFSDEARKISVEMKSVNHRYLDINIRIPKKLSFFESGIRNVLKQHLERGKIDVFITYEDFTEKNLSLKYNSDIAREYLEYLNQMSKELNLDNDIRVSTLSRYPEVFSMEELDLDEDEIWRILEVTVLNASKQLVEARTMEGENLKNDLIEKLNGLLILVNKVEGYSPQVQSEYRLKLEEKVRELLSDTQIEESRMLTEVVLFAEKACVDEEIVRLRSHIEQMKKTLGNDNGVGRKLDFIAQEMNREANTILSKANDITISNIGIDLKTEIEKIREQIQNIE